MIFAVGIDAEAIWRDFTLYASLFKGFAFGGLRRGRLIDWPALGHDPVVSRSGRDDQDADFTVLNSVTQRAKLGTHLAFARIRQVDRMLFCLAQDLLPGVSA